VTLCVLRFRLPRCCRNGAVQCTCGVVSWTDIEAMTPAQFKTFENRLRRAAERQGYRLEKSRRRDERAITFQMYRLVDLVDGALVGAGQFGYGLDVVVARKVYSED
jgi:hypothetical protein